MKKIIKTAIQTITASISDLSLNRESLLPTFELTRSKPKNLIEQDNAYFVQEYKKAFNDVTKVEVKNAILITSEGLVIKGFHILDESLIGLQMRNWYSLQFLVSAYIKSRKLPQDKYLYVYNHYGVGYGHWLADILPRLFVIKDQLKDFKILLPENYNSFHFESLAPFGISADQIVYIKRGAVYKVPDLTLISHVGSSCNTKDEILQELREFYLDFYVGKNRPEPFRKLYISRAGVSNRKVINNDDVEVLISENGYEIIHPQNYNFAEQVKLFSECKVMVGLTGSGLTNMLFMPAGGSVVEFKMTGDFTNLHYFSMTSAMQLDYYYLLCNVNGEDRFSADFYVDCTSLNSILTSIRSHN